MKVKNSIYVSYLKPSLDLIMAVLLTICLTPLALLIILGYLIQGEKPIFFCQDRVGKNDRVFRIIKFRSLVTMDDGKNVVFPMGLLLRKTSLDEIPQLLNIIKQDMSFIGPRPLLTGYMSLYNEDQRKRHQVKPGVTGWAQVNGRNQLSWPKRFDLDLYYVNNVSFLMDLKIAVLTLLNYFQRSDVVPEFNQPFKGNR